MEITIVLDKRRKGMYDSTLLEVRPCCDEAAQDLMRRGFNYQVRAKLKPGHVVKAIPVDEDFTHEVVFFGAKTTTKGGKVKKNTTPIRFCPYCGDTHGATVYPAVVDEQSTEAKASKDG